MMGDSLLSRPFDTRRIGSGSIVERISTSEAERRAIAASYDLVSLERLDAELSIEGWSRVGVKVDGRLRAEVVQSCVVTLEPVPQSIDHRFSLTFLPPEAIQQDPKTIAEAVVIVHVDEDDPPDALVGHSLDLGAIIVEQFVLSLDPYPRAPGATLSDGEASGGPDRDSPFAALGRLRDKG